MMAAVPRVLLIEDDPSVREAVQDFLEVAGIAAVAAADGATGIQLYEEHRDSIEVVLLDYRMTGLSGGETMAILRQLEPGLRIIMTSGYRLDQLPGEVQPDYILHKPYHFTTLIAAVERFLN